MVPTYPLGYAQQPAVAQMYFPPPPVSPQTLSLLQQQQLQQQQIAMRLAQQQQLIAHQQQPPHSIGVNPTAAQGRDPVRQMIDMLDTRNMPANGAANQAPEYTPGRRHQIVKPPPSRFQGDGGPVSSEGTEGHRRSPADHWQTTFRTPSKTTGN